MPSEPSISTASSMAGSQSCSTRFASAAELRPCVCACRSPRLRDMLMDGQDWCGVKTRCVLWGAHPTTTTCAPASSIRCRSSGRSGLWSRVSSIARHGCARSEPRRRVPKTALESPTCAASSLRLGSKSKTVAVVPLVLASIAGWPQVDISRIPPSRGSPSSASCSSFSSLAITLAVDVSRIACISSKAWIAASRHHSVPGRPSASCGFLAAPLTWPPLPPV
mmetsp:Transcript_18015/g.35316  ORF Transcript_18015/g.35316 Transcript_18015/m.35316 type:complete len:222 (+) Transcript_18015:260-925(+)